MTAGQAYYLRRELGGRLELGETVGALVMMLVATAWFGITAGPHTVAVNLQGWSGGGSNTANISSQRRTTSTTAESRAEASCVLTSRGGCTKTRHSTPTMTMAADEGSKWPPNRMMVAYKEATPTMAGTTACTPVRIAMRKLCFNKTGWGIWDPLRAERLRHILGGIRRDVIGCIIS